MRRLFPLALIAILSLGALSCGGKGESETETAAGTLVSRLGSMFSSSTQSTRPPNGC